LPAYRARTAKGPPAFTTHAWYNYLDFRSEANEVGVGEKNKEGKKAYLNRSIFLKTTLNRGRHHFPINHILHPAKDENNALLVHQAHITCFEPSPPIPFVKRLG
jgi:hypothetical protein